MLCRAGSSRYRRANRSSTFSVYSTKSVFCAHLHTPVRPPLSKPFCDSGTVLQVNHNLQSRLPRPAERAVEVRDAARMPGPVAEDEIRYGNAYEVDSVTDDNTEILQGDVGFAVPAQFLGEIPFGPEGYVRAVHPDFIVFGAAGERFRLPSVCSRHAASCRGCQRPSRFARRCLSAMRLTALTFGGCPTFRFRPSQPMAKPIRPNGPRNRASFATFVHWSIACAPRAATRPLGMGF